MLAVFREIEKQGEDVIVTDNNNPVLRIQPIRKKLPVEKVFADLQGQVTYYEDMNATTEKEWKET